MAICIDLLVSEDSGNIDDLGCINHCEASFTYKIPTFLIYLQAKLSVLARKQPNI